MPATASALGYEEVSRSRPPCFHVVGGRGNRDDCSAMFVRFAGGVMANITLKSL